MKASKHPWGSLLAASLCGRFGIAMLACCTLTKLNSDMLTHLQAPKPPGAPLQPDVAEYREQARLWSSQKARILADISDLQREAATKACTPQFCDLFAPLAVC